MKRFVLLVVTALIAAFAIWYGLRVAEKSATIAVTSLLSGETLLFVHMPDFNRTRDQWHQTDIYQIGKEPAVREFLQKPFSKIPKRESASQNLAEFERLEPKDVFFAVISWTNGLKLAGGFRFKGSPEEAEKTLSEWRLKLAAKSPEAKRETVEYQQHRIETMATKGQMLASVYDGNWFFVTNDLAELKSIIDRADGRLKDRAALLSGDAAFSAAFKHMPSSYATLIYGRLDRYFEKMMPLLAVGGASAQGNVPIYRQMRAFCGTLTFTGGKVRDVLFISMPQLTDAGLSRSSLVLGTKETFFYLASFLNLPNQIDWPLGTPLGAGLPGPMQRIAGALSTGGVTLEEWNTAFGPELGMLGDWPPNSQWPAIIATVPVRDAAKANQVLIKMTASEADVAWAKQEKDGIYYFSVQSAGSPFSIAPTLALSNKLLIAGTNESAVEAAMKRSAGGNSELASSENFRAAEREVSPAKQAFFYIDSALLYSRLDTALRPMLLMSAAFIPSMSEKVDLTKLPPAEVITKHLSPIVMSQNYQTDGYVTESVGPITMYQAAATLALLGGGATMLYRHQTHGGGPGPGLGGFSSSPSPTPSPNQTP